MKYMCPVCGYPDLEQPAADHNICPSCGTQFSYHDSRTSHAELRREWLKRGALWHSRRIGPPTGWDPFAQLRRAGMDADLPAEVA